MINQILLIYQYFLPWRPYEYVILGDVTNAKILVIFWNRRRALRVFNLRLSQLGTFSQIKILVVPIQIKIKFHILEWKFLHALPQLWNLIQNYPLAFSKSKTMISVQRPL